MITPAEGLVYGALIALASSLVLEVVRMKIMDYRGKKLFRSLLKIEIPMICPAIDALAASFRDTQFLNVLMLIQIASARQGYDRHRDRLILFKDTPLRDEVLRFYERLLVAHQDGIGTEAFAATPAAQPAFVAQRRGEILAEFRALVQQGRTIVPQIDHL